MSVVIRMKRTGRRNRPCYRISVADSRLPRDGRTLETLGLYDPIAPREEMRLRLDVERARHWIEVGAMPSDTVRSIFKRSGVFEGRPEPKRRKRTGRRKATAKRKRRVAEKAERATRKESRAKARKETKAAARRESAAAES